MKKKTRSQKHRDDLKDFTTYSVTKEKKITKGEMAREILKVDKEYRDLDEKMRSIKGERDKLIISLSRANKIIDHIIYLGAPAYYGDSNA